MVALVDNPSITNAELMRFIPGPDFPTGGELVVGPGLRDAYETGSGSLTLRAAVAIEGGDAPGAADLDAGAGDAASGAKRRRGGGGKGGAGGAAGGRQLLVVSEVPYQCNKAALVAQIAELVEAKAVEGVADVRDESDRTGARGLADERH